VPAWIAKRAVPAVWKRIPWKIVWTVVLWLGTKGRERVNENLSHKEQSEFWTLLKKSKGQVTHLSKRDRTRMKNIAGKAIRGS
jgi:hypothetical protein